MSNFTIAELTASETAARRGLDNTPDDTALANMTLHLLPLLERIRAILGHPMHINSGYRSPAVNAAVGGSAKSAHMHGYAADFVCPAFGTPLEIVRKLDASGLAFDQCIWEAPKQPTGGWVHVSADPRLRRETLTAHFGPTGTTYTAGA